MFKDFRVVVFSINLQRDSSAGIHSFDPVVLNILSIKKAQICKEVNAHCNGETSEGRVVDDILKHLWNIHEGYVVVLNFNY